MPRKLTAQEFIEKAKSVHGDMYDYSESVYINAHAKVKIICSEHGVFEQTPHAHLRGQGCPKCGIKKVIKKLKSSLEEFIKKSITIHNNKYDYSQVNYKNNATKVKIICKMHGIFEQTPANHLKGSGCPKCAGNKKLTTQEFIEKAISVHGEKYNYSLVDYVNIDTKVKIICPEHGIFEQRPDDHSRGQGCPKCGGTKKSTTQEFIEKAISVHGDKYDYSEVNYVNNRTKVKIVCSKHDPFWQRPNDHLNGQGCPKCSITISKQEQELADYVSSLGHKIIQSYRGWCPDRPQLEIDIFVPELNLGFEFNGNYWHSKLPKEYHKEKTLLALNNNIKLIHIWEDKWLNKQDSIKHMIKERLQQFYN